MKDASFASLNPSLLARKGGARPAMRPQLAPLDQSGTNVAANLEDLGWNDMGHDGETGHAHAADKAQVLHLTPEPNNEEAEAETRAQDKASQEALGAARPSAARQQQEELAARVAENVPSRPAVRRRSALARGKRAAFTLRLDEERHLKLRLLSTVKGRSAQQIVTEALDAMLAGMDDIESLAAQVKRR